MDRSVALLVATRGGGLFIGSAIAIEVIGCYFLATAAHNLEEVSSLEQVRAIPGGRRLERPLHLVDWNCRRENGSHKIDVGWIEVETVSGAASSARFLPISFLYCYAQHQEKTAYYVLGFPEQAVDRQDIVEGVPLLTSVCLGTESVPATESFGPFQDGVDFVVQWPPSDLGRYENKLPRPWGVSGGGVWILPRYEENPRWSFSDLRLAAISRSWHRTSRQLISTTIENWLRLLAQDRPQTRREIEPLLQGRPL